MEGNQPIKVMGQNGVCLPLEMCDVTGQVGLFMRREKMTLSYQKAEKMDAFLEESPAGSGAASAGLGGKRWSFSSAKKVHRPF